MDRAELGASATLRPLLTMGSLLGEGSFGQVVAAEGVSPSRASHPAGEAHTAGGDAPAGGESSGGGGPSAVPSRLACKVYSTGSSPEALREGSPHARWRSSLVASMLPRH